MSHTTAMGEVYDFAGYQVVIIQQWCDPFGKPMVRIAARRDGHLIADGMPEDTFLARAVFVSSQGPEIVEGETHVHVRGAA